MIAADVAVADARDLVTHGLMDAGADAIGANDDLVESLKREFGQFKARG